MKRLISEVQDDVACDITYLRVEQDGAIFGGRDAGRASCEQKKMGVRWQRRTPGRLTAGTGRTLCEDLGHPAQKEEMKYRMPLRSRDYVDVAARAVELGCRIPVGIALLPGNFATAASIAELRYHTAAPLVRSAWRSVGLIDAGPNRMTRQSAPRVDATGQSVPLAVYFGGELLTGPSGLVTLALGTVASVLTLEPNQSRARDILFDAVVERQGGGYVCLEYRGDACELVSLGSAIRGILAGNPLLDIDTVDAQVVE